MDTLLFSNKFYRILEKATDPDREKRYDLRTLFYRT